MIALQRQAVGVLFVLAFSTGAWCAVTPAAPTLLAQATPAPALREEERERLRLARQLLRAGRHDDAVKAYRALFPKAFPDDEIELEYAQALAGTASGREAGATLIAQLARRHPDDPRYQVAWATDLSTRRPVAASTLSRLRDLSAVPAVARQAREAWRRAVLAMDPAPETVAALRDYIAANPGETAAQERLDEVTRELARKGEPKAAPSQPSERPRRAQPDNSVAIAALEAGRHDEAEKLLTEAIARRPRDAEAIGSLGLLRLRQERHAEALELFQRARQADPATASRWEDLAKIAGYWSLMRQAREAQAAGAHELAEAKVRAAAAIDPAEPSAPQLLQQVRAGRLRAEAKSLQDAGRADAALAALEQAQALEPLDPWLALELARLYAARGEAPRGEALFAGIVQRRPADADARFAWALFLESAGRESDALAMLERIAPADRSEAMARMQRRLWVAVQGRRAGALLRAGEVAEAERLVASIGAAAPEQGEALGELKLSLALGRSESLRAKGRHADALQAVEALPSSSLTASQLQRQRFERARALRGMGRDAEAMEIYAGIAAADPAAREAQVALLDGRSRAAERAGDVDSAVAYEQQVLALAPEDTWRYRRLAELLDQQLSWNGAGLDVLYRSGTRGKSHMSAQELVLGHRQGWTPLGRGFFRVAPARIASGSLESTEGFEAATFGTLLLCQPTCGGALPRSAEHGVALSAGAEHGNLRVDVGTTPLGFPVVNLVGGALYKGDWGPYSYAIDVSRRALASSLLSYAGTRDPNTGRIWGGVVSTGVRLGGSRDSGGDYGAWALAGLYRLTGRDVQDNDKAELMGGVYRRFINEENRQLAVGVGGMLWRFSENAGEFTFGHGGYYSPRNYGSISLPATFAARTAFTSYYLRASVSVAWSESKRAPFYPTDSALQSQAEALAAAGGIEPFYAGGSNGRSYGRAFAAAVEHHVAANFVVGARLDIERSTNYTPSRLLLYARITPGTPVRPPAMPPEPFVLPGHQY